MCLSFPASFPTIPRHCHRHHGCQTCLSCSYRACILIPQLSTPNPVIYEIWNAPYPHGPRRPILLCASAVVRLRPYENETVTGEMRVQVTFEAYKVSRPSIFAPLSPHSFALPRTGITFLSESINPLPTSVFSSAPLIPTLPPLVPRTPALRHVTLHCFSHPASCRVFSRLTSFFAIFLNV